MQILILGGTSFVGRYITEAALAANHQVTLFNRGETNPGLFAGAEEVRGDRDGGLDALAGREWDAVIDVCGYVPRVVKQSVRALRESVEHYTFISSVSVYADRSKRGVDERASVDDHLDDPDTEEIDAQTYGPLKARCEAVVQQGFPGRSLIIRPGTVVGPHDPTDRFTYWPRRIAEGGDVLVPEPPERGLQFIDARDHGTWVMQMVENTQAGVFNAIGPPAMTSMRELFDTCAQAADVDATPVWVDESFLLSEGVRPWRDLPMWMPTSQPSTRGMFHIDNNKAETTGLRVRPLHKTVADTLMWARTLPPDHPWEAGLSREREAELLEAWRARA